MTIYRNIILGFFCPTPTIQCIQCHLSDQTAFKTKHCIYYHWRVTISRRDIEGRPTIITIALVSQGSTFFVCLWVPPFRLLEGVEKGKGNCFVYRRTMHMGVLGCKPRVKTVHADKQRKACSLENCSPKMCQTVWQVWSVQWSGGTRWTGSKVHAGVILSEWT